jgi:type I restriction enzyme, S subunit
MYGGFKQIGRTGLLAMDAAINQALTAILVNKNEIDPNYLLHWLNAHVYVWRRFAASSRKDPNITRQDVGDFPIAYPCLAEQRRISELLNHWDEGIQIAARLITAKIYLKRGLMQQLLNDKKRFKEFQSDEWHAIKLGDVASESRLRNDGRLTADMLMAVTKAHGIIPMRERVQGERVERCKIVSRNWFAYNPMRLNIGSIAMWQSDEDVLVSPDYVVFKCDESRLDPTFLNHFRHTHQWSEFVESSGDGSVRVRIYFSHLASMRLRLPSVAEQRRIAEVLDACDREIALLRRQLDAVRRQKRGLMQKLLTGQIRVRVDESASAEA